MVDWKKEIKLSDLVGGGKKDEPADTPADAGGDTEPTSIWKKEISFGRKKQPKPVEVTPPDEPAAVELVDAYVPPTEPEGVAPEPVVEPAPLAAAPAPAPEPVVAPAPLAAAPDPVADVVELLAGPVEPAPEPLPTIDLAAPAATAPEPPPALTAAPEVVVPVPAAAPVAPEPVVVHPPVPSAQLPPLPEEQPAKAKKKPKKEKESGERVPFYKRDLSFGRKKTDKPDVAEFVEQREKPKRERRSLSLPRPTPRAARSGKLPKRVVGLKIGASQLAAATVENNGHAEVVQVARQPLDPGVVSNGELRDPDLLAEALRAFFKQHKLPRRGVRLGIATNRIGVRTLEIGGIDDPKQLANAIRFRAQEALPIPIDEAVLDYTVLSESKNDEGETTRKILLVLAYRDLIDRYVTACRKAGIQLVGIDLEAFALLRALAAPREEDTAAQAALVAVTVGHDRTTFAVSDGRVCEFTRVLDWGGQSLNVALARALDMAPSEVEDVKHQLTLDGHEVPDGLREEQAHKAREALRRQVQSFARELVSSLQFYQNQPGSLGIGEIVLTGGTAHLVGFADELQRLIGVRVRIGDPLVRVKVGKKLREPEQIGSFSVAIGLGIED
jgi:type IV pilus assembly protein PilM